MRRRHEAHQAVLAAGQAFPLDGAVVDDEGEGDGDHREVGPGHAQRGQRQQCADDARDNAGDREREPEAHAVHGQDRGRVGADGVEPDMAERDLPAETRAEC